MEQILKFIGPTFLSLKEFGFAYGIQGSILRRNFERYWFLQCVTSSKYNTFFVPSNVVNSCLEDIIDNALNNTPFGIAEISSVKNTWNLSFFPYKTKSFTHKIAKVTTVYESDNTISSIKDLFYKKQRERRTWWRKISENPGIYFMTAIKKEKGKEYAEIEAQFPFGNIVVERIYYKNNVKNILPTIDSNSNLRIVEHITSLDWACLVLLCDGYTEIEGSKELHIHPKFSPYKAYCIAKISPDDDESIKEDLVDLTLYVIELLRGEGVESVILNYAKQPEVFKVPYIITVDRETLKSGLLKVVSQRTLCGEIVHISYLAKHMYDLCV